MRPPEFTGGNHATAEYRHQDEALASMRPPEFTGGNDKIGVGHYGILIGSFNEAAGIHRRKPIRTWKRTRLT